MTVEADSMSLSPSRCHRRLMDTLQPELAYAGGDVRAWQGRLKRKLRELLGYHGFERVPLNARVLWEREHALGRITKLVYTSEPCADVPAYLCIPNTGTPPYPVAICLQGHTTGMHNSIGLDEREEHPIEVEGDRDFALGCLRRGVAAFCIEQRCFGQRAERHQEKVCVHYGCQDAAMHALMLGRTLAAERVYDVDRAIDYLETRPDLDLHRLGILGNSGGGTIAMYAGALLPRLRASMPSCAVCTFRDSVMSIFHCVDNYVPGLYRYADMADLIGLFAPRPVVVVAGRHDDIFPFPGVQRAFEAIQRLYHAAGAEDRCHIIVGEGGHRFYADAAWPIFEQALHRVGEKRARLALRRGVRAS